MAGTSRKKRRRRQARRAGRVGRTGGGSPTAPRGLLLRAAIVLGGVAALWLGITLPKRLERAGPPPPPSDPAEARRFELGKTLYAEHCATCHGAKLEGAPDWRRPRPDGSYPAPPHDGSGHTWHHPDAQLFRIIERGGQATAPRGFPSRMPAFGEKLTNEEIRAVLFYIKRHWSEEQRAAQQARSRQSRP